MPPALESAGLGEEKIGGKLVCEVKISENTDTL